MFCKEGCQEKVPSEKSPPWGVRGRVRVRLGIGLGLEPGGLFPGGFFPRTVKKVFLEFLKKSQELKTPVLESIFNKSADAFLLKERLRTTQVLSCEFEKFLKTLFLWSNLGRCFWFLWVLRVYLHNFDRKIWWTFIQQFLTSICKLSVVNEILYSI